LNLWIGVEFLLWVRYYESNGSTVYVNRPSGVDGWLPIAGLMNLKYFLYSHQFPTVHPAAMVLVVVFLLASLLLKKTFCSWLCPVGTVSEYLWKIGQKLRRQSLTLPRWVDIPLRGLKYLLLAAFLFLVVSMSADALGSFMQAPFGILADVKMLDFFRHLGLIGISVIATLCLLSVMIQNVWCRFLCPYGALMGILSAASPVKIRRDADACIDCAKCAKACPSHLPVDKLAQVRSVECTGCMECVAACPAQDALQFSLPPRNNPVLEHPESSTVSARWKGRTVPPRMIAAALALIFFGLIGAAEATGHWKTNLPREVYMQLVPNAAHFSH
jgi:polyferredoxin